ACAIAGNIGMNSGGAHCLKYGVTTNNLLGVTMVLMDGTVVEIDGAVEIWLGETKVWTEAQYRRDEATGTGDPYHWGQIDSDY
ncbi:FAD-binding oxidoreductase, partial [Rhodovulum visakhapatnamense]|uniref:FAD-binding oxidoreductase n=1 Tax=Rhodovulum visakhapatnamense TaxID=364297 RepID=UPI001F462CDA